MAAVTKSSGAYFSRFERVWKETRESGVLPFWVGKLPAYLNLPVQPNPQLIQSLCDGRAFLNRVQANRIGCYDLTFSFAKSISFVAYGLTPPSQWKGWTQRFVGVTRPHVEQILNEQLINSGPQGRTKIASCGVASGFSHWQGFQGQVAAHVHYAIPNLSSTDRKAVGSVANAHRLFEAQGVLRAKANKGLDDELQAQGFETIRLGKKVELKNVPRELIDELSPARRAMNRAQKEKGFSSAKALDFYAREARRTSGRRVLLTPEEVHREATSLANKYGVTIESLKRDPNVPAQARDPAVEVSTAYRVAKRALDQCTAKYGQFTENQFLERLYTLGIGQPTTVSALEGMGKALLTDRNLEGVRRQKKKQGGQSLYTTKGSYASVRQAGQPFVTDSGQAWEDLKTAVKGLGGAVLISTAKKATEVVERLADFVNPPAKRIVIDSSQLEEVIQKLRPTNYLLAHAKAIVAGLKASGTPHQRAGVAEQAFAELRRHKRIPRHAVLIIERGLLATARELRLIEKIARRDGASVVLSDRDPARLQKLMTGKRQNRQSRNLGRNP